MSSPAPSTNLGLKLLTTINSIALIPVSETVYQIVNEKPEWLGLLGRCSAEQQLVLDQPDSYLENFLVDAHQFWLNKSPGSLRSGKWVQTDAQGIEHPFEAMASTIQDQPVLLVQQIAESYLEIRCLLQSARENAISREKIEHLAYRDDLTGLYNRRGFLQHAEESLLDARYTKQAITIACIDLDRLKLINDQYGHQVGDQVIANAASLFKKIFRQGDLLGRIGGDEFLALMINMDSAKLISFKARLKRAISDWNAENDTRHQLSFSIGLASDNGEQQSLEELISEADVAMYQNKYNKYQKQIAS